MKYATGLLILGFIGYILDAGYTKHEVAEHGQLLLIDSRAMGRTICDVSISNGEVAGSRYVFND